MAKSKNIKKTKKGINWTKIGYYFKSLFNNEIAKEIGVKYWAISILIFFISITCTIIPTAVTESTRKGSSSVNNSNNDLIVDVLYKYATSDSNTSDFKIENHKLLRLDDKTGQEVVTFERNDNKIGIYYLNTDVSINGTFAEQRSKIVENNNTFNGFIFLGNDAFTCTLYKDKTLATQLAATSGGYKNFEDVKSLKGYLNNNVDSSKTVNEVKAQIMTNFYTFCDTSYLDARMTNTLIQVGMLAGINAGVTIIMTLVLYIMSRGKQNPNSLLKFYQVLGIGFYTSITPALLSMILGFMFAGAFQTVCMLYIMTYGFRCMWLAMKYLRPQYQN